MKKALFSEKPSFQGHVQLIIQIANAAPGEIGLMMLAIRELWYGIQPLGGDASIGRGILEGTSLTLKEPAHPELVEPIGQEELENGKLSLYNQALYHELTGEREGN